MKPAPNFTAPLRVGAAAVGGFASVELAAFSAAGIPPDPRGFALSLLIGFGLALLWALGLGFFSRLAGPRADPVRLTVLVVSLALLFLTAADRLADPLLAGARRLHLLFALAVLFGLTAAFGRALYLYLSAHGHDLAKARFQTLGPVAVISAGLYSAAVNTLKGESLVLAVFALLAAIIAGQYLGIRLVWGGRRERWRKLGLRAHYLFLIAVPLLAAGLLLRDRPANPAPAGGPEAPPIILISVDALRSDFIGSYNPKAAPTPAIDRLASDGIVFEHAVAPSNWTLPSVAAIMTGKYPENNGAGRLIDGYFSGPFQELPTLAQALSDRGYITAGRFINHLFIERGFEVGFQSFSTGDHRPRSSFLLVRGVTGIYNRLLRPLSPDDSGLTSLALSWLHRRPAGPFFLWLHYFNPHLPYTGHAEFPAGQGTTISRMLCRDITAWKLYRQLIRLGPEDREFVIERYRGEVRFSDRQIGRLLDHLRAKGIYDRSVIILTADHGEEMFDRGDYEHGHSFHNEVISVPLIVKLPGNRHAGTRVSEWVSLTRVPATIMEAAGLPSDFGPGLLPCLSNTGCPQDGPAAWRSESPLYLSDWGAYGARDGIKIIKRLDDSLVCFDLNFDPDELVPLPLSACPDRALTQVKPPDYFSADGRPGFVPDLSEETRRRIRALGYVQ